MAPDGRATMVSRGAYLVPGSGRHAFELYAEDWRFEAGHRLGVLVSDANDEWFDHEPSDAEVDVTSASIALPFLPAPRGNDLDGKRALKLRDYLEEAPFQVAAETIAERTAPFAVPAAPAGDGATPPAPPGDGAAPPAPATAADPASAPAPAAPVTRAEQRRARLTIHLRARRVRRGVRRIVVRGRAPLGARVEVRLRRSGRAFRERSATARRGRYRVRFRTRRGGRFRAVAVVRGGSELLRARSPRRTLRPAARATR